ncbi:hypothetical protein R1sor_012421 [Riccia sorocarpa]|uniref:Aldehyde dehydrogenase domain-containing protein n=1 Tax=Riccia sorocarpa TaxID=122646 RepID=A0ABD3I7I4_9MARC
MAVAKVPSQQFFIRGEWVAPARGGKIPIICPTTEEQIGQIPAATAEDVDAAVKAARQAFTRNNGKDWSRASGKHRAKILRAIAGKCFDYYADLAEKLDEKQYSPIEVPMEQFKSSVLRETLGVIGLITPGNYPPLMGTWKVAAALAAGCTAVLKPSEVASVTCLELGKIAQDVGLPLGALNIITGLGPEAGAPLSYHPDVDKVSFAGSYNTGRTIMKAAAETVKPVTLELGGKSPLVIFDDVDLDKAVEWAMFGALWTNGQICGATSRVLVQEGIAPAFLKKLAAWTSSIKISNPLEKDCHLGPLVNDTQYQKVKDFVKKLKTKAQLSSVVERGLLIWRKVTFWNRRFSLMSLGNKPPPGLGGAVISKDEGRCKRVAELLDAGIVWINCSQPCFCQAPWGDDPFGWYPASKL